MNAARVFITKSPTAYLPKGCRVKFSRYGADHSPAILLEMPNGEPAATATVCLPGSPPDGHVWLKDWSENDGIPQALAECGVLTLVPGKYQRTGFVIAPLAKLSDEAIKQLPEVRA